MSQNLMLAIWAEHKARTGHDVFKVHRHAPINCDVCLYIGAEKREQDKAEAEYWKEQEAQAKAACV